MRLKKGKPKGLSELVVQKVVKEAVILAIIIMSYVGYVVLDNMFISRSSDKEKKIAEMNEAIKQYEVQIKEYKELWQKMLSTGEDKRVVYGITFAKIESMFKAVATKFNIREPKFKINATDPGDMLRILKFSKLPPNVGLVVYKVSFVGLVDVETDVYNMMAFISRNFPGVVLIDNLVIDADIKVKRPDEIRHVKSLKFEMSGDWFFLNAD